MAIIITGASSGIGKALYELYVENKEEEEIYCISRTKGVELRKGDTWLESDLSDSNSLERLIGNLKTTKEIKALIHCAGIMKTSSATSMDYEEVEKMFKVNTIAPMLITSKLTKQLAKRKGCVIFISSIAAELDIPGEIGYGTTKMALVKLARGFNSELNRLGIRYFVICPSYVKTAMTENLNENQIDYLVRKQTSNKILDARKIGEIIIETTMMAKEISGTVINATAVKR